MKKKKGFTIVEILVSLSVFSIVFLSCVTTMNGASKALFREKEYITFETICLDIDAYASYYGKSWYYHYFTVKDGDSISNPLDIAEYCDTGSHSVYYNESFELCVFTFNSTPPENYKYVLSWKYEERQVLSSESKKDFLIINIYEEIDEGSPRYIVQDLDYGYTRFN